MSKRYKISAIIYSLILVFSILFMTMLLFASGHQVKIDFWHYSILIVAFFNIVLLYIFPKISEENKTAKTILRLLITSFSITSLYFALKTIVEILSENLIPGFVFFALILSGIFITSIIFLSIEIFKKESNTSC